MAKFPPAFAVSGTRTEGQAYQGESAASRDRETEATTTGEDGARGKEEEENGENAAESWDIRKRALREAGPEDR